MPPGMLHFAKSSPAFLYASSQDETSLQVSRVVSASTTPVAATPSEAHTSL